MLARLTAGLAVAGGLVMLALAVLVTTSVLLRWLDFRTIPGDFELVQMGVSIATFAFLPLCQLQGENIFVDTFTRHLRPGARRLLDTLWALVYLAIALLLAWRMGAGALDALRSGTTSMVLGLPLGWAILLGALLTAWLAVVVLATAIGVARRGRV
jgi:TRAP-type C4-dicarboxylate transport system permease small subunit